MNEQSTLEYLSSDKNDPYFDFLEKMPMVSLKRNDLCFCLSGKKYKKCCLEKKKQSLSSVNLRLESFTISMEPLTIEESKYSIEVMSEEDSELLTDLFLQMNQSPETIDSEECNFFKQLNILRMKYPDSPVIMNYLSNGYQILGDLDSVDKLTKETYSKFPDYLFARLAMANIYLIEELPEKAIQTIDNCYSLKSLYPERDVFHVSEAKAFHDFMIKYFSFKEDWKQVKINLDCLANFLDQDDPLLKKAQKRIKAEMGLYKLKTGFSCLTNLTKKSNFFNEI